MATADLGELKDVDLRDVWKHEAHDFTPWLSTNLNMLSSVLGVDLELVDTEASVGKLKADIVCRVPEDGATVLIENQLAHADLQHLGQVLAYLAGLDAKIVIWIAREFGDAHRSALRWLNEHTPDPFSFFAIEVRTVRIGDSLPAPVFEVIERPNEWDRQVRESTGSLSKLGAFRRSFWAHLAKRRPDAPPLRTGYAGSNVYHEIEELDVRVSQYIKTNGAGMFIAKGSGESEDDLATRLSPYLEPLLKALEAASTKDGLGEIGVNSFSEDSNGAHMCWMRLSVATDGSHNWDQPADWWDQAADWLESRRQVYEAVLRGDPPPSG